MDDLISHTLIGILARVMMSTVVEKLKYDQLVKFTDNFSEENFLGNFQFGKVYRGIIEESRGTTQHVIVKIWEYPTFSSQWYYTSCPEASEQKLMLEVSLLQNACLKSHPGMIEMYGYCWDDDSIILGSVYNFNPLDTLQNLIPKDSFTWLQRIKVAVRFGCLLKFLHTGYPAVKQFLVRNIAASHIAVDKEYNPKLFDFSYFSGGIFADRTIYMKSYNVCAVYGYEEPYITQTEKADCFAFGILLLNLMTKRIDTKEDSEPKLYDWAWEQYQPRETDEYDDRFRFIKKFVYSLVDKNLAMDRDYCEADGRRITKLAMKCIRQHLSNYLSMKQVMKCLFKLQVVKNNVEFLELGPEIQALINKRENPQKVKIKKSV